MYTLLCSTGIRDHPKLSAFSKLKEHKLLRAYLLPPTQKHFIMST